MAQAARGRVCQYAPSMRSRRGSKQVGRCKKAVLGLMWSPKKPRLFYVSQPASSFICAAGVLPPACVLDGTWMRGRATQDIPRRPQARKYDVNSLLSFSRLRAKGGKHTVPISIHVKTSCILRFPPQVTAALQNFPAETGAVLNAKKREMYQRRNSSTLVQGIIRDQSGKQAPSV